MITCWLFAFVVWFGLGWFLGFTHGVCCVRGCDIVGCLNCLIWFNGGYCVCYLKFGVVCWYDVGFCFSFDVVVVCGCVLFLCGWFIKLVVSIVLVVLFVVAGFGCLVVWCFLFWLLSWLVFWFCFELCLVLLFSVLACRCLVWVQCFAWFVVYLGFFDFYWWDFWMFD